MGHSDTLMLHGDSVNLFSNLFQPRLPKIQLFLGRRMTTRTKSKLTTATAVIQTTSVRLACFQSLTTNGFGESVLSTCWKPREQKSIVKQPLKLTMSTGSQRKQLPTRAAFSTCALSVAVFRLVLNHHHEGARLTPLQLRSDYGGAQRHHVHRAAHHCFRRHC